MRTVYKSICASIVLVALVCCARETKVERDAPAERIGIYDSRAVTVAFVGSDAFGAWMAPLEEEHRRAKAAGDVERVRQLDAQAEERQRLLHTQGFGTAPVEDILDMIKERLPEVEQQAGVTALISKWDKAALAKHPSAQQVDVTMALVDALAPTERQRASAIEIQRHKPVIATPLLRFGVEGKGMSMWISPILALPSFGCGLVCSLLLRGKRGAIVAGGIPWFVLLGCLLYSEYFLPYTGGGASMWPIAQIFGGTAAAATGLGGYLLGKLIQLVLRMIRGRQCRREMTAKRDDDADA